MYDVLSLHGLHRPPESRDQRYYKSRAHYAEKFGDLDTPLEFQDVFHHDHLYYAFQECRQRGQAPGLDGVRYDQLSNSEAGELARALERAIDKGKYAPGERRTVHIAKRSGGTRPLQLGPIQDRMVSRAQLHAFSPRWEPRFLDHSYGFRPKHSLFDMLARLEVMLQESGRRVLVTADVQDAFGNVAVDRVLQLQEQMLREEGTDEADVERFMALLERVLRHEINQEVGIDQGDPLSPLLLNAILNDVHDAPLEEDRHFPFWLRYADNLVYLCRSVQEGQEMLLWSDQQLGKFGMRLKHSSEICELSKGESAELLGFELGYSDNELVLKLARNSEDVLRKHLSEAHHGTRPAATACRCLRGWVQATGLAYPTADVCIQRVRRCAAELGFREQPSDEYLQMDWNQSCERWNKARTRAQALSGEHLLTG